VGQPSHSAVRRSPRSRRDAPGRIWPPRGKRAAPGHSGWRRPLSAPTADRVGGGYVDLDGVGLVHDVDVRQPPRCPGRAGRAARPGCMSSGCWCTPRSRARC
jgi:hypothetical protein